MDEASAREIERLRARMHRAFQECGGNLQHPLVLQASQALDRALNRYWRPSLNSATSPTTLVTRFTFTPHDSTSSQGSTGYAIAIR
ncbi:MAG: aspartyl-phosphate phosphatase Spo0E family protein [Alicyclobacillus sp.]|nr:aspartyl-phosphate phosphatase Spo0E family protein [Alicyclobacillus sp.]